MSTVFESKPQAAHNLADISSKLEFQKQLQAVTNKIHATSNIDEIMLEVGQDICSAGRSRPPDRIRHLGGSQLDRLQGQDRAHLVQGSEAAHQRSERGRFRRAQPRPDQHPRRLRRERAALAQPAAALSQGGRQAHRLPHQADAGCAGGGGRLQRPDRRGPGDQYPQRPAVLAARRRRHGQSVRDARDCLQAAPEAAGDGARQVRRAGGQRGAVRRGDGAGVALGAAQEPGHRKRAAGRVPGQAAGHRRGAVRRSSACPTSLSSRTASSRWTCCAT